MQRQFEFFIMVLILVSCSGKKNRNLFEIEADSGKGFNFPYLLFLPDSMSDQKELFLIVEPNNSGFANDKIGEHLEKARRTASIDYYIGNYISGKLGYPLLVPVFPRPESDWKIYTHALDRDAILQKDNQLERIDIQLIRMIEDARDTLLKLGYPTKSQVLMTGFSASGTFANRFSLIHPEKIYALAAGGLNGLLMLPVSKIDGTELNYPLGTNDFSRLFNEPFDSSAFRNIPQYLFMGGLDENDAILFDDGYDPEEREAVFKVIGEKMQPDRWVTCGEIYGNAGIAATIITYDSLGHKHPPEVMEDILSFFISAIEEGDSTKVNPERQSI